jgi:glucose-1-phosphate thymidylyltransferase
MQGVVPAAGEGTRLRPLTADRPKGLVEVAGRPLLEYPFETLLELDVEELVVVVGYRGDAIRDRYGDSFRGVPVSYVRQERREGLAHALLQAESRVDGDFVSCNGDNVFDADLSALVERHHEAEADATVLVDEVSPERAGRAGVFEVADGEIVGVAEKPETAPSTLVPRGLFAFSPAVFDACRLVTPAATGEYELSDAVDLLLSAGRTVAFVEFEGWCRNVNTPADREAVAERLG